jgi:tetratricopeptide (TPR) repeat protein
LVLFFKKEPLAPPMNRADRRRAAKTAPAAPDLLKSAHAQFRAGDLPGAEASYRKIIRSNPKSAAAYHGLGLVLRAGRLEQEAAKSFSAAARLEPGWALAWHDLGMTLAMLGDLGLAAEALRRALTINPSLAETRRHLLAIEPTPEPTEIAQLQTLLTNQATPPEALVETGFALGKLLDKAGDYDAAFAQFALANQRLRALQAKAGLKFDLPKLQRDIDKLIAVFSAANFAPRSAWGDPSEIPVFIVGMPRSGTSLVEQILASHPAAYGAGEIKIIGDIAAKIGWGPTQAWTPANIKASAKHYLAGLTQNAAGKLRVSDKMPDNIFQLGLIATLFPNARIIFSERDPLDTCFSCFTQRFSEPHGFDTDLADCGARLREIARLTRHWQNSLPLKTYTVSYEKLVADTESESRKLIDFLGLPWDPACLDFHRTQRVVKTASWAQVRQPAYQHAAGRAQNYRSHLTPLIQALNP